MSSYLAFIMKVTRACPLRCSYCNDWRAGDEVMPFEVVASLIAKALHHAEAEHIELIWHGGEPLLLGKEFYKKVLCLQAKCRNSGLNLTNVIQTNGFLLDESWIDFFRKYGFCVGLSLDGPGELHNSQRASVRGQGSFDQALRALRLLKSKEMGCAVAVVVTQKTLEYGPERMFDFLLENDIDTVAFLRQEPKMNQSEPSDYNSGVGSIEFSRYMQGMFDVWYENDNPSIYIRNLDNIIRGFFGKTPILCCSCRSCIGQFFGINVNGDIYHCDRYAVDSASYYRLGNIVSDELEEVLKGERIQRLNRWNENRIHRCRDCHWFSMCYGGCPCGSRMNQILGDESHCGEALLIEHIYERLSSDVKPLVGQPHGPGDGPHSHLFKPESAREM